MFTLSKDVIRGGMKVKKTTFLILILTISTLLFSSNLGKFWFDAAQKTEDPILKELYLHRAIRENKNLIGAYKALGIFYYSQGKVEKAKKYLEFLPKKRISLPGKKVIKIVKPVKPVKPVKKIETLENKVLKKLDTISKNLNLLGEKISKKEIAGKPEEEEKVDIILLKKFDEFSVNVEKLLTTQNVKIDSINKNYMEIAINLNKQKAIINQLVTKGNENSKNIEALAKKFEIILKETTILKKEVKEKAEPKPVKKPEPVPVIKPVKKP